MSKAAPLKENFADLLASEEACWRAVLRRDARLDGLLYYGVASTRIYCRPVCRARRPKVENVAFFRSCDEAERAGYRPCKLCHPQRAARPHVDGTLAVRPTAVLFLDIRGYSALAAQLRPDETFALLDDFHARMRAIVEAHGGAVHKHLGDGFMAIFGAGQSAPDDARRALAGALALADAIEQWSDERRDHGASPIAIGIGLHYGMAAFGPAGGEQAIIGDTVNVASRLERLTRRLDTTLAVSDETLSAISKRESDALRARLRSVGTVRLPGCGPRRVWVAQQSTAHAARPRTTQSAV
ncbi:MAG TPA: Ada metal-binding domain-containing protein [Stellaceae bacterium]|nr:Ada metal-binding domain-containing protein [Stellaceae bacterium]